MLLFVSMFMFPFAVVLCQYRAVNVFSSGNQVYMIKFCMCGKQTDIGERIFIITFNKGEFSHNRNVENQLPLAYRTTLKNWL